MPKISMYFEPRDIWIGVYWNKTESLTALVDFLYVYICIIPCFPIRLVWKWNVSEERSWNKKR